MLLILFFVPIFLSFKDVLFIFGESIFLSLLIVIMSPSVPYHIKFLSSLFFNRFPIFYFLCNWLFAMTSYDIFAKNNKKWAIKNQEKVCKFPIKLIIFQCVSALFSFVKFVFCFVFYTYFLVTYLLLYKLIKKHINYMF